MVVAWPFVGRTVEIGQLRHAFADAGAIVVGPAGIGKTALMRRVLDLEAADGSTVHRIRGSEGLADVPMGAFIPILGDSIVGVSNRIELVVRGARALLPNAAGHRVVVGVDDVHQLDALSVSLIRQCLDQPDGPRFLLGARPQGGAVALTDLWSSGHLQRVDLKPFTMIELQDVCLQRFGSMLDARCSMLDAR